MASGKRTGSQASSTDRGQHANGSESLGEELGSAATGASESVQEAASEVTQNLRQQLTSRVTAQQERAVDTLEHVALLLQQAGEHARKEDQATIAQLADQASGQVERFSTAIRDREPEQLLADTKQLAQTKPGLFVGGALLAGFLGARFLRSSAQPQTQDTGREQAEVEGASTDGVSPPTGADVAGMGDLGEDVAPASDVTGTGSTTDIGTMMTGMDPAGTPGALLNQDAAVLEEMEEVEDFDGTADPFSETDPEPETR